ncbi:MAG TPA: biopolymer transporter ExbD [Chitinispirillaceae bacterium]|nr:biopolymer transporter ExbD [Chitinispirillaceae bacterium]
MANPRAARQARRRRGGEEAKLNITSMMDMFTIILVFLLKNFSTEGAIVTPADNLTLPQSTVEKRAKESLSVKMARNSIMVENSLVIDEQSYAKIAGQKEFLIKSLYDVLVKYSEEARKMSKISGKEFSGEITIQGDVEIPYNILTRVMYTCGQAGYPNMNLFVYRQD